MPAGCFMRGDAYFFRDEIGGHNRHCPPGLRAYQTLMEVDRTARLRNQSRLRELSRRRDAEVGIFCAHDAVELEQYRQTGSVTPT